VVALPPCVTLSGDAADEYLSDGLSEELIHALAGVAGLRVLGRTTSFAMKGRNEDARTIGQELAVDAVLQGSVRRSGSRLRITAHLTNTTDAFELWTERYDREMSDVFAVQDEIAGAIAQALTTELLTAERPAASTADPAAYERFLLARHHWNRRTETAMYRSVGLLEESLSLDPGFAPAFAALAESHVTLAVYGAEAPATAMQRARQAADRALALSPRLGEALSARACVRALYDWDWAGAASDFQQAITASPQYPTGYQWFAMNLLVPRQRFPQAFQQLARARELDPLSPVVAISLGLTHFFARDYASAINAFGELLDRDPSFGPAHAFLGQAFTEAGQPDEGIRHLRRALELVGGSVEFDAALGVALARAGDTSGAREVLHRLEQQRAERYVSLVLLAQVHAALGAPDQAVANLRGARDERASDLAWIGVRPAFDPLRGDSGFRALLAEVGLAGRTAASEVRDESGARWISVG
jgi:TolB-like protein/tetratricopeptide (TPR) repeat protein